MLLMQVFVESKTAWKWKREAGEGPNIDLKSLLEKEHLNVNIWKKDSSTSGYVGYRKRT